MNYDWRVETTRRKVTLSHGPDGVPTHATCLGFDPDDDGDVAFLRQLREAIEGRKRVIAFDADVQVDHIYETREQA